MKSDYLTNEEKFFVQKDRQEKVLRHSSGTFTVEKSILPAYSIRIDVKNRWDYDSDSSITVTPDAAEALAKRLMELAEFQRSEQVEDNKRREEDNRKRALLAKQLEEDRKAKAKIAMEKLENEDIIQSGL